MSGWRRVDSCTIRDARDYQISRSTVRGADAYTAWRPRGSASEDQRALLAPTMAIAAEAFGLNVKAGAAATARARQIIGIFDDARAARAACDGDM